MPSHVIIHDVVMVSVQVAAYLTTFSVWAYLAMLK